MVDGWVVESWQCSDLPAKLLAAPQPGHWELQTWPIGSLLGTCKYEWMPSKTSSASQCIVQVIYKSIGNNISNWGLWMGFSWLCFAFLQKKRSTSWDLVLKGDIHIYPHISSNSPSNYSNSYHDLHNCSGEFYIVEKQLTRQRKWPVSFHFVDSAKKCLGRSREALMLSGTVSGGSENSD